MLFWNGFQCSETFKHHQTLEDESAVLRYWLCRNERWNVCIQNTLFKPVGIADTTDYECFHGRLSFITHGND